MTIRPAHRHAVEEIRRLIERGAPFSTAEKYRIDCNYRYLAAVTTGWTPEEQTELWGPRPTRKQEKELI